MFSALQRFLDSQAYWALLLLFGIALEATALYFQYGLDYGPCPLCIHTRIGVLGFVLVALLALLLPSTLWRRVCHLGSLLIFAWLAERAYLLLGTERGFVYLECGVDPGLPGWLALDSWLPFLFEVKESCGYTPKLLFGVSMAEALIVLFPLLGLVSLLGLIASFRRSGE